MREHHDLRLPRLHRRRRGRDEQQPVTAGHPL